MISLSSLGFRPFFEEQILDADAEASLPARIAAEHRGAYELWSDKGSGRAELAGKLRLALDATGLPGVGDWVLVKHAPGPDRITPIEKILARQTVFTRAASGREARVQVIAANVDRVFAVCGLDADYNLHRLERYLARIWASGASPTVILNKADLCDNPFRRVAEVERHLGEIPVHVTSALHREGLDEIRQSISDGLTVALVGSSGAGKSTLVNALVGEERMRTGEIRARDGRGCHTTSHRQLVLLPGGGLLLDTPGMRELELLDQEGLDTVFEEIRELGQHCRFRDCQHETEPGCAVLAAVESNELARERLEHYRKLGREARAFELRHDEHRRRKAERIWGQLSDEIAQLRKWKGET